MGKILYVLIFILSVFDTSNFREIDKMIGNALRNGDAKELSKFFTSSVKISIHRNVQIASKYQAELIVSEYLSENKLSEIKISRLNESQPNHLVVYNAKTHNKPVRILIKTVKLKESEFISEFRVE